MELMYLEPPLEERKGGKKRGSVMLGKEKVGGSWK